MDQRTKEIYERWKNGERYESIAVSFNISSERVRQIVRSYHEMCEREQWLSEQAGREVEWYKHADCRIRQAMFQEGCATLAELAQKSDRELLRVPNFSVVCLRRLRELMGKEPKGISAPWASAPRARKEEWLVEQTGKKVEWQKGIDARLAAVLEQEGCTTLAELAGKSDEELLRLYNFGAICLRRLRELTGVG